MKSKAGEQLFRIRPARPDLRQRLVLDQRDVPGGEDPVLADDPQVRPDLDPAALALR